MAQNPRRYFSAPDTPPAPDLSGLPAYVGRRQAAQIITRFYFPVSARSLERWPVSVRHVNGKAVTPTAEYLAQARDRFEAAPVLATGAKPANASRGA